MRKSIAMFSAILLLMPFASLFASGQAEQAEQDDGRLNIIIRGVEDGVNHDMVMWITEDVIPAFEERMAEEGRDVQVGLIQFGGSDEALEQQIALDMSVGEGPDIMAFDGFWIPDFVEAGYLEPLDEIAGEEIWDWDGWDVIPEDLRNIMGFDGEIYGLGAGTDVRKIYYRTDIFEDAGIDTPWQPESWSDIVDTARTLKDEGVPYPLQLNAGTAMGEATTMQGYLMALLGAGEHMYDFDNNRWYGETDAILDTLNFYEQIYVEEELGSSSIQLASTGRDQSFEAFREGEIAMLVEGDWFWRSVVAPGSEWEPSGGRDEVVGWAKMPAMEPGAGYNGNDFVSVSGGTGFTVNPNTSHPELAWELLAFMHGYDMQMEYQDHQPRMTVREDVPVEGDEVMSSMAEELLQYSTVRPQLPEYAEVSIAAQRMTERVVNEEMSPQEAMEAYAEDLEEIVGSDKVVRD